MSHLWVAHCHNYVTNFTSTHVWCMFSAANCAWSKNKSVLYISPNLNCTNRRNNPNKHTTRQERTQQPCKQSLGPCSWWVRLGANNMLMSHMNNRTCDTYLWSLSPPQGCVQDRRRELFRHIQTWGTQQLQWVILGETCDNRRLNTDEPIPPTWHHIIPPISVSSPFTGVALQSLHKDTQWTVASG